MQTVDGFPDTNLKNLPSHRAPKYEILKKVPKEHPL